MFTLNIDALKIRIIFYKLLDNISILSAAAGYTGVPFKRPNRKYTLNSSRINCGDSLFRVNVENRPCWICFTEL